MTLTRGLITSLFTTLLLIGCGPKTDTSLNPPPPEPNPEPQLAGDARQRIKDLVARADEYAAGAATLPAPNEQADRAQLTEQFALLAQILPMLNGPDMSGDFRQQLRIIESTRAQLANASSDLSIEPAVDTGLRAAHHALASISQRKFSDLPDIAKHLDSMRAKADELDSAHGPLHRLAAAQAIQASAQAISQMANALDQRLK